MIFYIINNILVCPAKALSVLQAPLSQIKNCTTFDSPLDPADGGSEIHLQEYVKHFQPTQKFRFFFCVVFSFDLTHVLLCAKI